MDYYLLPIIYRDCDVSYNCNDRVRQSVCSVLTFMRNSVLLIFLFVNYYYYNGLILPLYPFIRQN